MFYNQVVGFSTCKVSNAALCTMIFSDAPRDILPPPVPAQNRDLLLLSSQFESATMTSPILI